MTLCPSCTREYHNWLTAGYLPGERTEYTLTDKRSDLTQINHDRWKHRIQTQLRLIRDHCAKHQEPAP